MTFGDLRALCVDRAGVYLTLKRETLPRGDRARLLGSCGPLGQICTVRESGKVFEVVAWFAAAEVLSWLDRLDLK